MKSLSSRQNPLVKHLVRLRTQRSYRQECASALLMHSAVLRDLPAGFKLRCLLTMDAALASELEAEVLLEVTSDVMEKITGLAHPPNLVAEVELPPQADLKAYRRVLALDGVSDPGNVGTILRTALALGYEAVFMTEGTADPFSDKALRAGKGAIFHLPWRRGSVEDLRAMDIPILIADLEGVEPESLTQDEGHILVLGSEVEGVSPEILALGQPVSIPMEEGMESLNVAVAGGILMYILRRGSRRFGCST